jgi:FkbM family methyltransferase
VMILDSFFDRYRAARRFFDCRHKIGLISLVRILAQCALFGSAEVRFEGMVGRIPLRALVGLETLLILHGRGIQCRFEGTDLIGTISGYDIRTNSKDSSGPITIIEAFLSDEYKLSSLDLTGGVVVDVGANIGDVALRMVCEGAKVVHSFEPVPSTYEYLTANIHNNNLANRVFAYPFGLANSNGSFEIVVKPYASACAQTIQANVKSKRKGLRIEQIEIREAIKVFKSLDLNKIRLLKIDCEGCEYQLLSQRFLDCFLPENIALEFHNGSQTIEKLLLANGYSVIKSNKSKNVGMIYAKYER